MKPKSKEFLILLLLVGGSALLGGLYYFVEDYLIQPYGLMIKGAVLGLYIWLVRKMFLDTDKK